MPWFYNYRLVFYLRSQLTLEALIYEIPASDEVSHRNKMRAELTNCSTDHTCNANTCSWSTSKTGGSISTFITAIVLWCAVLPSLWAPRYHCSTVQWVMGIAKHWQSEFHSQPYTRRQFWRSASIYSLPLSPAGVSSILPLFLSRKYSTRVSHFTWERQQDK